ncbi:MAG: hypothetical protein V4568_13260 [Pseudomonadota bacterium]
MIQLIDDNLNISLKIPLAAIRQSGIVPIVRCVYLIGNVDLIIKAAE